MILSVIPSMVGSRVLHPSWVLMITHAWPSFSIVPRATNMSSTLVPLALIREHKRKA